MALFPRCSMRFLTLLILFAFLVACTRQVVRPPVPKELAVDWGALDPSRISWDGLEVEGVVLTPARWPLEGSLKNLLRLDFIGVIDAFDLRYHSSSLREDVLEKLFDEGYLPAYLRVKNGGAQPRGFLPARLVARADGETLFYPVPPGELPARFREMDWARTGLTLVLVALVVVLVVLGSREGGNFPSAATNTIRFDLPRETALSRGAEGPAAAGAGGRSTAGLLRGGILQPGEAREGFLFFRLNRMVADWGTVTIESH